MGGESSQTANQSSQTQPWDQAQGMLKGILGQIQGGLGNTGLTGTETGALNQLSNNAAGGNPFTGQIGDYARSLFSGGGASAQADNVSQNFQGYGSTLDNLNGAAGGNLAGYQSALTGANSTAGQTLADYSRRLSPTADGSMIGANSGLQPYLDTLRNDITSQVNGSFAGAGRDFSGANQQALGRGISQGLAPVIAGQYNTDVANQRGAADALFNGGNTTAGFQANNAGAGFGAGQSTGQFQAGNAGNLFNGGGQTAGALSGMQQQYVANQGQGVNASQSAMDAQNYGPQAQMAIEAQRRGIPVAALGMLAQLGVPIAGLGSQSTGQSSGTQQMAGADQFGKIAGGIGNMLNGAGNFMKFMPSDLRLKQDIEQVGTLFDGQPVYRYRYKNSITWHIGLIAQEVEQVAPDAVCEFSGFKHVDYRAATEASRKMKAAA